MRVLAKQVRVACLLVLAECGRKAVLADLSHLCLRRPGLLGQASAGRGGPAKHRTKSSPAEAGSACPRS